MPDDSFQLADVPELELYESRLRSLLKEIHDAGFDVWGFDDGSIQVYRGRDGFEIPPMRHPKEEP
jgi:hypothetical protein